MFVVLRVSKRNPSRLSDKCLVIQGGVIEISGETHVPIYIPTCVYIVMYSCIYSNSMCFSGKS